MCFQLTCLQGKQFLSDIHVSISMFPRQKVFELQFILGVVNGPLINEKSRQILPKSWNLTQPSNGSWSLFSESFLGVCRSHIYAFLSSH